MIDCHNRTFSSRIPAELGAAIDSGAEETPLAHDTADSAGRYSGGRPSSMRLLSYNRSGERGGGHTRSVNLGGSGDIGIRTKKRDYDSAPDDEDVTLTASLSRHSGSGVAGSGGIGSGVGGLRYSSDSHPDIRQETQQQRRNSRDSRRSDYNSDNDDDIPGNASNRVAPKKEAVSVRRVVDDSKARDRGMLDSEEDDGDEVDSSMYSRRDTRDRQTGQSQNTSARSYEAIERDSDRKPRQSQQSSSANSSNMRRSRYDDEDTQHFDHDDDDYEDKPGDVGGVGGYGSRTFDSGTGGSGSAFGLDSTHSVDDGSVSQFDGTDDMDFNQTVNTDVSMPGGDVEGQADEYEREVRSRGGSDLDDTDRPLSISSQQEELGGGSRKGREAGGGRGGHGLPLATPPSSRGTPRGEGNGNGFGGTGNSSRLSAGTASPFDNIASDFDDDDGSLELSQSVDNFANMMAPSGANN